MRSLPKRHVAHLPPQQQNADCLRMRFAGNLLLGTLANLLDGYQAAGDSKTPILGMTQPGFVVHRVQISHRAKADVQRRHCCHGASQHPVKVRRRVHGRLNRQDHADALHQQ